MVRRRYRTFIQRSSGIIKKAELAVQEQLLDQNFNGTSGIGVLYLLYDDDQLYYVGKASKQGWRRTLQHHKNRHKKQWNQFVLLGVKLRYLTVLESLLIAVARPPGNRTIPRIPVTDR